MKVDIPGLPFVSAVAWGMIDGPPMTNEAERQFEQKLNRELKPYGLRIECRAEWSEHKRTQPYRTRRHWRLYCALLTRKNIYSGRLYSGRLMPTCLRALEIIHGMDEGHLAWSDRADQCR